MTIYEGTESACIAVTPAECFEAMIDFEALPGWQRALKRCEVISRDEAGLGHEVLYESMPASRRSPTASSTPTSART